MDEIDAQIEAARAELAALRAESEPSMLGQFAFDVPVGVARAGAGLADFLSYPVVKGLEYAGAPVETFGLSKLLTEAAGPETPTQEVVSFLAPSPLSKVKLLSQAGTGLASYLGMKGAEKAMPESQYAGLVGALAGPGVAKRAGKLAGAGVRAVSPAVGIAAGSDEALQAAAQAEVLRQAGTEGAERLRLAQQMPELATGTGGVPLTAAEIVQTPSLAQYQQEIAKKAGATDILGAAREARNVELQAALERLGITPETGDFGIALRDAAEQAAKKKAASEGSILRSLGLTEEAAAVTKTERGATLREAISTKMDDADNLASEAWRAVPKETKLDATDTLKKILTDFNNFDELDRADAISDVPKLARVLNQTEKYLQQNEGIITVGQLQGLRRAAGRAMTEASGKNKTAGSLMGDFRENLETTGLKYFYDQTVGAPGGLPGTAATATDLNALQKLSTAIDKTREAKQIFNEGVVGEITALRRFKPKLKTSSVIDRALKNPENASEIVGKFGKDSVEATELRLEMLGRLDKATNPTDFLGRNKDTLKAIFGDDYAELNKFAQQKGRGTGLEQFERITDTQIPNKIFADVKQANAFMERFQGTELEQYARAKFIKTKLTKSGNAAVNLDSNKKIAQRLFGADYNDLQKVVNDLELSKTPSELARAASKGQSITSQSLTSLGAIAASRGVIGVMKQGALPSSIVGGFGGGWLGATAGLAAGAALRKTGQAREIQMDKFVAEILANPSLIKFAAAPPTEANIRKLIDIGQTLQRGAIAAGSVEAAEMAAPTEAPADIDAAIETARRELEALRGTAQTSPQPEAVSRSKEKGKGIPTKEVSALLDEVPREYGINPRWVKAIAQVESSFNPKAVGPKTRFGQAQGLMQLMPATARALKVENPFDPKQAIEGASKLLVELDNAYGKYKDKRLLFAAYNSRPSTVKAAISKARAAGKDITWENIAEYMPIETQNYVREVTKLIEA
jgi:soluble lytic murein transglycosylase-like protein